MQENKDQFYFSREARIIKNQYGIDFADAERSAANVRKLEHLLWTTYPANEAASPTCPYLTIAEQAAINILQTRLVLKHKTMVFNKEWPKGESISLYSGKDQVLQGIDQAKPSRSGRVFLSIGSSEHESPLFLNHTRGVVITVRNNVITQRDYLQHFWLSPHIGDMIKSADFGKIYFMNSAKRMFYRYNKHQKDFPNGYKTYQYYRNEQLVIERTVSVLDECVSGADIIPFLLKQFILELRYLGGDYRLHVLHNFFDHAILHSAFDTIINTDSFEVSKPGVLYLLKNQCHFSMQYIWPVLNDELLAQLPCNKYAERFRKGNNLTQLMIENAVGNGHQLFFKKLLKHKMPINACFANKTEGTKFESIGLLHLVVKYQQQPMLTALIEANVDVRLRDARRRNIAHYALMTGTVNYLSYILSLRTKYQYDHSIQYTPNLNSHVYTIAEHPLFILTKGLHSVSDIPKLIELGLRIDGQFGSICLFILLMRYEYLDPERENIILQLIVGGADINYRVCGIAPLMLAADKKWHQIVEMLINNGALVNLRSYHHDKIKVLFKNDTSLTLRSYFHGQRHPNGLLGKTALMFAAEVENNHRVITQLLNAGADVSLSTRENKCAADYAVDPTYFPDCASKRRKLVEEPTKPTVEEIGIGVACVMGYDSNHTRYYCLGKRIKPIGQLFFPGGYFDIEEDGNLKETATRELREETSLALQPVNDCPLDKIESQEEKIRYETEFYLYNAGYIQHAPVFANDDLIDIAWVPESEILQGNVCVFASNLILIQQLSTANRIPKQLPARFFQQHDHMPALQMATAVAEQKTDDNNDQQLEVRLT